MLFVFLLGSASTVSAATIPVAVGFGGLVYRPNNIKAAKGDIVSFQFVAGAHSVSQSGGFDAPCDQLQGGFDSAFVPAANGTQVWELTIEDDSKPIWFFCKQGTHCQQGMAGVINAASPDLIDTYINNAKAVTTPQPAPQLALEGVGASASRAPALVVDTGYITIPAPSTFYGEGPASTLNTPATIPPLLSLTDSAPTATTSSSGASAKPIPAVAIAVPLAGLILAAGCALICLRLRRRRQRRELRGQSADEVVPYAVSVGATETHTAKTPVAKMDPAPRPATALSDSGQTTVSELRELHAEMQRALVSVQRLLSSLRAPRDAVSEGSPPQYEA